MTTSYLVIRAQLPTWLSGHSFLLGYKLFRLPLLLHKTFKVSYLATPDFLNVSYQASQKSRPLKGPRSQYLLFDALADRVKKSHTVVWRRIAESKLAGLLAITSVA